MTQGSGIEVVEVAGGKTDVAAPARDRPLRPIWIWAALIFTALCIIQGGHQLWSSSGLPSNLGATGLMRERNCATHDFCRIDAVMPDSPAAHAGLRAGDTVKRVNQPYAIGIGETVTYIRKDATGETRISIVAVPAPPVIIPEYIVSSIILMLTGALGGLVIARSGGRRAVVLIGLAYASYAITGQWPRIWQLNDGLYPYFYVVLSVIYYGSPLLFLAGARAFRREVSGRDTTGLRLAFWALIVIQGGILAYQLHAELTGRRGLFGDNAFLAYTLPVFIGYALSAAVLAMAWRESAPEDRSRYGIMLIAIGATFLSGVFDMGILLTGNDYTTISPLLVGWYVSFTLGAALFAYAILRHKVVDLGFAVNRTLVYGVLSTTLLFGFFFLEWGMEQIIPAETREANILISAGIAFVIFLVFHHLRDWVEKVIEHIFFRAWRNNDAGLKRFVRDASYITRADALRAAAVSELRRFSGGADVALYDLAATGAVLREGFIPGLGETLNPDTPALVRLRADREPLDGDLVQSLGAALMLPIIQRSEVIGLFILGAKPSGEVWRPDERTALAEAAARVGLDLHALEIERLEGRVAELNAQLKLALDPGRVAAA